ncbi:hypothetical protein Oweho_1156 [Owenweeksia hongkongensis DSM 17368]|uniref:Lipoprotein n=1 Tax=Owenweeksia hongkongensis (strain DSM 17368 / CIP 108786 / JCM 12287 / NRRL B-23963 / UST20020801) TaxID=926562 RepID=G8R5B6_OWEHD|nr:hypothetical protein Oweho_1156 [Owenweeksia hongkongensis DSM 17368]
MKFNQGTKFYQFFTGLFITITFVSCNTDVDFNDVINVNEPYLLYEYSYNDNDKLTHSVLDTILVNSSLHNQFTKFLKDHNNEWQATPASYICDFSVQQNNFRLLGWKNSETIIVSFIDQKGIPKQLYRKVNPRELEFITQLFIP